MKCIIPDGKPSPLAPSPKFNLNDTFLGIGTVTALSFPDEPAPMNTTPSGPPCAMATELLSAIPNIPFVACRRM